MHSSRDRVVLIEIIMPGEKVLFGSVYRSPSIDDLEKIENILFCLTPRYSDDIIFGDLNENMLSQPQNKSS